MDAKIAHIRARQVVPECVERLREALAKAESGQLQAVAIACLEIDDTQSTGWGGYFTSCQLIGAVDYLKFRLLEDLRNNR